MTNVVRYRDYVPEPSSDSESESDGEEGETGKQPAAARKEIVSDTTIQVRRWGRRPLGKGGWGVVE